MRCFDYLPGPGAIAAAWPVCALIDQPAGSPLADKVFMALDEAPVLDSALRVLVDEAGAPLAGFALLQAVADGLAVAVAGSGRAIVGDQPALAAEPGGVAERSYPSGLPVRLHLGSGPDGGGAPSSLPLHWGVGPAAAVGLAPLAEADSLAGLGAYAPIVTAVLCPKGHPNPPGAGTCRVCGRAIAPGAPATTLARPALGRLRLASGAQIPLDRGAVFGRNPHAVTGEAPPVPNLVRITDPEKDISSQHAEVRLDGWQVLVVDLGSTNGTQAIGPDGGEPVDLAPGLPLVIEPGTRVVLAHAFEFTYEL